MTIKDFTVGQTAYTYSKSRGRETVQEVTVKKIGRVYVTIGDHWETKFSVPNYGERDYLIEKSEYSGRWLFRAKQDLDDYLEKRRLVDELHKAFDYGKGNNYTLAQLRAVKKIIDGEETT